MNSRKHTWSHILNKTMNQHSKQLDELVQEYECSRDSQEIALIKAENVMLPAYPLTQGTRADSNHVHEIFSV